MGLSSPSANRVVVGDPFTSAFGIWERWTARAGMVATGPGQLPASAGIFFEEFWKG